MLEGARQADRLRSDRAVVAERFERLRQAAAAQQRLAGPGGDAGALDLEPARHAGPDAHAPEPRDRAARNRCGRSRAPDVEPDEPVPSYMLWGLATVFFLLVAILSVAYGFMRPGSRR
jgi:hypothetical protein